MGPGTSLCHLHPTALLALLRPTARSLLLTALTEAPSPAAAGTWHCIELQFNISALKFGFLIGFCSK